MMRRLLRLLLAATVALATVQATADPPPPGRYMITNGTVFDTKTKLTWQQSPAPNNRATVADAKVSCAGLSLNGATPWRVPTIKELLTIVDLNPPFDVRGAPTIDSSAFPGTTQAVYWSSTPTPQGANEALGVDFLDGRLVNQGANALNYVRCVR